MSFFYFGETVVEPVQLWLKKVYFYIVENPTGSCFVVILLIIFLVLAVYKIQIKRRQKKTAADFRHPNVAFYSNQVVSEPDGDYIDNILTLWKGDYYKLEKHHGFMQWLFPIPDMEMNSLAHPLTDEEAKIIRTTPELKERVKRSFEMMLDFFGMELRTDNMFVFADNGTKRLQELNQWSNHNFLRISRILLALKLLGHSDLMLPWMKFLFNLIHVEKVLDQAAESFKNIWIKNLDAEDVIELNKYMNVTN